MYKLCRVALITALLVITDADRLPAAAAGQPEYAKWGQIAIQQTSAKYHAAIVDYLHIGRAQPAPGITEEKFKFRLRKDGREFGVYVTIQFYTRSERIIAIRFHEATH